MRLALHILGTEVLALTTDAIGNDDGPGDVTATPLGFTWTTPGLTDGRYGMDDRTGDV